MFVSFRLAPAVGLAALLLLATVRVAFGHALYERSEPASGAQLATPGEIRVWFTEAVEPGFTRIEVLDSARRRVDSDDNRAVAGEPRAMAVSVGALPDGTYTVSWRALSAVDGHVTRGVFPLVVGAGGPSGALEAAPAAAPSVRDVAARWLGYLALLALTGGFLFRLAILAPALKVRRGADQYAAELLATHHAHFRELGLNASLVLFVATFFGMLFQAASAADVAPLQALGAPLAQLQGTRLGLLWQGRLTATLLTALLVAWGRGPLLWWGGLGLGAAHVALITLSSHAAAIPNGTWLAAGLDWVHQLAAAAWVGGLFSFGLLGPPLLRRLDPAARVRVLADLIPRFSTLAVVAVTALALTGAFQSWLHVTTVPALDTYYGWALVAKLLLTAPLLGLGAANLLVARPRLARAAATRARDLAASLPPVARRFQWAVTAEAALGVAVLLATAVLTATEPARESYARQPRPIELVGAIEDVGVRVLVTPARPGPNTVAVALSGADGQPPADVQRVAMRFTYLDQDLGSGTLTLERRTDAVYAAIASNLSTEGNWQIDAVLRRRGREDAQTSFRVQVASPESASQPPPVGALVEDYLQPRQAMAIGLVLLGVGLAVWLSRRRGVRRRERLALYAASLMVALIGGALYARADTTPRLPAEIQAIRSPIPPDATSLARGRATYEQLCVSCHGPAGRGDGPLAPTLRPRPADLRTHMQAGHTDGELFSWVSNGMPGTAMPAFAGQLSEAERWHVINFIRSFAPVTE